MVGEEKKIVVIQDLHESQNGIWNDPSQHLACMCAVNVSIHGGRITRKYHSVWGDWWVGVKEFLEVVRATDVARALPGYW